MTAAAHRRVATTLAHVLGGNAEAVSPVPTSAQAALSPADVTTITRLLDHDNHEMRDAMKKFMDADLFLPVRARQKCPVEPAADAQRRQRYDIPLRLERELALERLQAICNQRFFSVRPLTWRAFSAGQPPPLMRATLLQVRDFNSDNPYTIFAAHEVAAFCDGRRADCYPVPLGAG